MTDSNLDSMLGRHDSRRDLLKQAGVAGAAVVVAGSPLAQMASAQDATPAVTTPVAAAGGNTPRGPQVDGLVFWTRASPDDVGSPNLFTQIKGRADAYTAATGTPIDIQTVPDADFRPRMSAAAPGGQGPDVFGPVAHDWIGEFAIQEIALPISVGPIDTPEDFQTVATQLTLVNGQQYAVPLQLESVALIYNRALVPTPPTSWDELVQMANGLNDGTVYGFGFPLLECYYEGAFFQGFGSYVFAYQDGTFNTADIGLNNAGAVEAAKFLRDMFWLDMPDMPEAAIDRANMAPVQEGMMEAGQLGMTISGPWRETPLTSAGIDYGVAVLPTLPNGQPMKPFVGCQAMLVNAYSQKQEAALDFVNFLTGTDSAVEIFAADRKVPARSSALQSEAIASNPWVGTWAEQALVGLPMPNIAQMTNVWEPWAGIMDAIIPPNTPDDQIQGFLDQLVEQIQAVVAE